MIDARSRVRTGLTRTMSAASALAITPCLVACGAGSQGAAPHLPPRIAVRGGAPATVTRTIALGTARHVTPPAGVQAQMSWVVGGGSSFMADCNAETSSAPRVGFSRLPYNGAQSGSPVRPLLGESFAVCVSGLRTAGPVELAMTRPDGHVVRARETLPTGSGSATQGSANTVTWYPPLAPWDPPGHYVMRARQGRVTVTAGFNAGVPRRPAFRATRFFGRPGETYPIEVVGLRSGQRVRLALYRQSAAGSSAMFVAGMDAVAGAGGTILYLVQTSAYEAPQTCFGAEVRVDGRELSGAGGVGEFCLQPESG